MKTNLLIALIAILLSVLFWLGLYTNNIQRKYSSLEVEFSSLCNQSFLDVRERNIVADTQSILSKGPIFRVYQSSCNGCKVSVYNFLATEFGVDSFTVVTDLDIGLTENYDNCIVKESYIKELDKRNLPYVIFYDKYNDRYCYFFVKKGFASLHKLYVSRMKEILSSAY